MLPLSASAKGMVSPSKPATHSRVASHQQSAKLKLVKGLRPLANYRFYLDIEKHHVSSKIDRQIKALGGSIEFFLVKEVTHFVTDKPTVTATQQHHHHNHHQEHISPGTPPTKYSATTTTTTTTSSTDLCGTPRTPKTPYTPSYLNDPFDVHSPHAVTETRDPAPKPLSRADAMLQRARRTTHTLTVESPQHSASSHHTQPQKSLLHQHNQQPQQRCSIEASRVSSQHNPVQLAKSWGTPIWTADNTLKFLAKVAAAVKYDIAHNSTTAPSPTGCAPSPSSTVRHSLGGIGSPRPRAANTKRLKGDYIKVEAFDRNYRPYYKEFHGWPTINLQLDAGFCPFWQAAAVDKPAPVQAAVAPRNKPLLLAAQPSPRAASASAMTRKSRSKSNRPTTAAVPSQQPTVSSKPETLLAVATAPPANADTNTNTELKCGYCEICHIEYDVLAKHLQSVEHLKFVRNNDNFITLDAMIGTGASMDTFLARQQQQQSADSLAQAVADDATMKLDDPLALDEEEEHVFGKRSAGKKSVKPFRANGRSSGGGGNTADIKRAIADRSPVNGSADVVAAQPPRANGDATSTRPAKVPKMSAKRRTTSLSKKAEAPAVPLLERSSKAAAKVAVAAVVAVETADDDDDDEDDLMTRRGGHKKMAYVNGGVNSVYDKAVRFCNVPPLPSSGSVVGAVAAGNRDDDDQPNRVRARRESAKRINYDETKEDDDVSPKKMTPSNNNCGGSHSSSTVLAATTIGDSTAAATVATGSQFAKDSGKPMRKIKKIRLRSIRWRAPSDEERRSTMSQPFYKVVEGDKAGGTAANAATATSADVIPPAVGTETNTCDSASTTPSHLPAVASSTANTETAGLKLRVCRVRNSELSALTNEADKFMFPRLSSSDVTDEDRHTTSEFGAADMSADVMSSSEHDRGSAAAAAAAAAVAAAQQQEGGPRTAAALDASNKRKRRNQLEAFLNDNSEYYKFDNLDNRLRFQEAPFQPTLGTDVGSSSSTTTTAAAVVQTRSSPCTTPTKLLVKRGGAALAGTSPSARQTRSTQQQQPASPRTPTRASRRPARDADDGKGAFGTPTRAQQATPQTPTTANVMSTNIAGTSIAEQHRGLRTPLPMVPLLPSQMSPTTLARTDVTSALLKTDVVKMHKFAFERIPSQEPWYAAFQRQDECRERIFEYWGSTAYRKLPYELGPLPPHPPDCCALAKLTPAKRVPRQPKAAKKSAPATAKRTGSSRQTAAVQPSPCQTRPPSSASNSGRTAPNTSSTTSTTTSSGASSGIDRLHDIRVQKRLLKLHKNLEVNVLPNHHSQAAPPPSAHSRTATLLATASSLEVRLHKRRIPVSQRQQLRQQRLAAGSSSAGDEMRCTLSDGAAAGKAKFDKSDGFLLDINGRPRKSPREHASTLAILSCLVQQRRKREKELNGGISPEKHRSPQQRRHRSARDTTTTDSDYEPESEDDNDDDDADDAGSLKADDEPATTVSANDRRDAKAIKLECDSDAEPMDIPADPPPTPPPDDADKNVEHAVVTQTAAKPAATNVYPPMPDLHYVSPRQICSQIDDMFAASERDAFDAGYLADMDLTTTEGGSSSSCIDAVVAQTFDEDDDDLVLIGTRKDFVEIVQSVAPGLLRYHRYHKRSSAGNRHRSGGGTRTTSASLAATSAQAAGTSLAVSRKRRNNRTGWPTMPRRRPTTATTTVASVPEEEVAVDEQMDEPKPNVNALPGCNSVKEEPREDDDHHDDVAEEPAAVEDESDEPTRPESLCAEDETTCSTALTAPLTERDEEEEEEGGDVCDPDTEADEQESAVEEEAEAEDADDDEDAEQEDDEMVDDVEHMSTECDDEEDAENDASIAVPQALAADDEGTVEDDADGTDDDNRAEHTASVVAFASHSEKAENSDIFTVSSDSVDTTDLVASRAAPPIQCSNNGADDDDDDPLSDADASLADIRQQSMLYTRNNDNRSERAVTAITPTAIHRSTPGRRKVVSCSGVQQQQQQRIHSSVATGSSATSSALSRSASSQLDVVDDDDDDSHTATPHRRLMLQPVVRMKKIQMMPPMSAASRRRSVRSEERLAATAATAAGDDCDNGGATSGCGADAVLVQSSSAVRAPPKDQFSPPKLRKPRGRWYRER